MQETLNDYFRSKKCNMILHQAKIGKHECHKIAAIHPNTVAKFKFINNVLKKILVWKV